MSGMSPPSGTIRVCICLILIVAATAWTYFDVHSFGYVDYDDPAYITGNPYVNSGVDAQNLRWAFTFEESKGPPAHQGIQNLYHPVTWVSHMIDVELFGVQRPGAQHLVNVAIHLLAGILLYFIFLRLLHHHGIACVTALWFCVHPLHVESVAWLSQRKDTLSALFAFASILAYQFHADGRERMLRMGGGLEGDEGRSRKHLPRGIVEKGCFKWISVFLFILALLSKPSVVILPGILMLLDQYTRHQMNKLDLAFLKEQMVDKLPWIIPSAITALVTFHFQQGGSHGDFMTGVGSLDRVIQIPTRLGYYLYQTINPTSLSFHYAPPPFPPLMLALGGGVVLVMLTVLSYRLRDRFPLALFALLWFYLCMLPMSGMVYVGSSFIADRYTYLAMTGIFACFAAGVFRCMPKPYAIGVLSILVMLCAWLARQQTTVWYDSYALFSHAIRAQPRDPVGYVNLGARYKMDGDLKRAVHFYTKAIEIAPNDYIARHNLAHVHLAQKQWKPGEANLLEALRVYQNYHPSMRALSELYRTVPEMRDLEKALVYTKRYNRVTGERDARMLGVEIEILLELDHVKEAQSQAEKLREFPNLTNEAKEFIEALLEL